MSDETSREREDEPEQPAGTTPTEGETQQKESGGAAAEVVEGAREEGTPGPTPGAG